MVGNVLREVRRKRGVTQRELGAKIGRTKQTISNIEVGAVGMSLNMAIKVAAALNVNPGIFLPGETIKICQETSAKSCKDRKIEQQEAHCE